MAEPPLLISVSEIAVSTCIGNIRSASQCQPPLPACALSLISLSLPDGFTSTSEDSASGLHTKRRPHTGIGTYKCDTTIRKERFGLLPAIPQSHRRLHPEKHSTLTSTSGQVEPHVSEPRMIRNDKNKDRDAWNRTQKGRRPLITVPALGRVGPTRVRKFIPKPLILVERMKARQFVLESSPPAASGSRVTPGSLTCAKIATPTPLSTHVTPATYRTAMDSTISSDSHSSSGFSFWMSLRTDVMFGSGFGMRPRAARPLSVMTLGDSSSSTDTFVADSPCCVKQPSSKVPLLVATTTDVSNVHLDVESDLGTKIIPSVLGGLVPADLVHWTCQSTDIFEPARTSTPFASSYSNTNDASSPTAFITSTAYPTRRTLEQIPGLSDSFEIMSSTSRAAYPFNAPKGAYTVKLPNPGSATSLSNRTRLSPSSGTAVSCSRLTSSGFPPAMLTNAPKPALDLRRLSSRVAVPSPTLVLDGVFALPRSSPSSSLSRRRTFDGFPRPRKPTSRRPPLSDRSNVPVPTIASPSQPRPTSPTSSRGQSGSESPRSKLAHVLTAHGRPQMGWVLPPLVKGVQVSNDPRTQREIEGLRVRRVVGVGRGGGDDGDGGGRGAVERMSLGGVGIVAKLRARWETGTMELCGRVDGRA